MGFNSDFKGLIVIFGDFRKVKKGRYTSRNCRGEDEDTDDHQNLS